GKGQCQAPERDRQRGGDSKSHDGTRVRGREHRDDEYQERGHGRVKLTESQPVALPLLRPQIARSMHLRSALLVANALVLAPALIGGSLEAQDASPYLPVQDWTMPYVEHLIAAGLLEDPTPLTRPLRRADVVRALDAVDTLRLGTAVTARSDGSGRRSRTTCAARAFASRAV